jgi:hypothetical protein
MDMHRGQAMVILCPLHLAAEDMHEALEVIAEALKEPAGGSYWPARAFLDERDICNIDLNDLRVLNAVARAALAKARGETA